MNAAAGGDARGTFSYETPTTPNAPEVSPMQFYTRLFGPDFQDPNAKEYEVDFDVKNTGEKKDINGFPTSQAVVTITVREKGKTLQQAGGMVMTSDMWLTPSIPAMKEVAEFRLKYAQKLYGPMMEGASPQDMVRAMAMYPQMKPALEKMAAEGSKLQGTPVLTTITFDAVKSAEQMAAEEKGGSDAKSSGGGGSAVPTSIGGLVGGFGRRMAQRKSDDKAAADAQTAAQPAQQGQAPAQQVPPAQVAARTIDVEAKEKH